MGVEPTRERAGRPRNGFEDREIHRDPSASMSRHPTQGGARSELCHAVPTPVNLTSASRSSDQPAQADFVARWPLGAAFSRRPSPPAFPAGPRCMMEPPAYSPDLTFPSPHTILASGDHQGHHHFM